MSEFDATSVALTPIRLPTSTPFPVIISSILCNEGESVEKHKTIFKYKYWDYQDDPNSTVDPPKKIRVEQIGSFESPISGNIEKININILDTISDINVELCTIKEPCTHTVQYGGLCALCGKSLEDERDYSGYNYQDRATISMAHDNTGLRISLDEATKIEQSTTDRLYEEKKLILVVDLDQTVIHATVDPTVGEWQSDPTNPNYPAVKDVKSFCLEEDPITPPGWTGPKLPPSKCWYYVKVRPGLSDFLQQVSNKYEMHIYTMATRNYALAIANIIDPDGKYFGDRILSRDESGSLTHKNLKRLFPVDQSMVVIIDDRGDVWQWESNLIKVVPYDFFVGIGDINSSFLPKKNGQITGPTKKRKSIAKLEAQQAGGGMIATETEEDVLSEVDYNSDNSQLNSTTNTTVPASPVERIIELGGGEDNANLLLEQSISRNQSIEQQQHDRPLAKLQHDLEVLHHQQHEHHHQEENNNNNKDHQNNNNNTVDVEDEEESEDENLLYDDDNELYSLNKVLAKVHDEYYKQAQDTDIKPDLTDIIPNLKSKCLEGITILFSGIIPLGVPLDSADIVIWAKQFGVKVVNEVYPEVTHVICRDITPETGPTFKARAAHHLYPDSIKIVNPDWLFACLCTWSKVDETEYLISMTNTKNWAVNLKDVEKYQNLLQENRERELNLMDMSRFDDIESFEEYDLDEANQEVDDFLAGLSEDDDDDDDDEEAEEFNDEVESKTVTEEPEPNESNGSGHDTFIQQVYSKKRHIEESEPVTAKKHKQDDEQESNEDLERELEQELLEGFDDLEE
ncbi:RNA polymerase II subunit A C-terminal domain phosphatase [Spathaspora sp. JA1]|nr:RNA polymerase II subunit A C-terminal domain phosphatase [Spathaspora sp. JA1]